MNCRQNYSVSGCRRGAFDILVWWQGVENPGLVSSGFTPVHCSVNVLEPTTTPAILEPRASLQSHDLSIQDLIL
jgi:hypothetical protein